MELSFRAKGHFLSLLFRISLSTEVYFKFFTTSYFINKMMMVMLMMMTILLLLLSRRTKDEIEGMWVDTLFDENISLSILFYFIFIFIETIEEATKRISL